MTDINTGDTVEFLGYSGDVPEDYKPSFKPGQPVKITRIEKDDSGYPVFYASHIDLVGNVVDGLPTETLFDNEFRVIENGADSNEPEVAPEDQIDLNEQSPEVVVDPGELEQLAAREYVLHPITDRFPEMSKSAYEELREDIRKNGQLVPIVVLPNTAIIDGKHRFRACQELGIPPVVEVYEGKQDDKSLFEYVRSLNARRRHLTAAELQAFAVKRQTQGATQRQIAKEAGVSQPAISKALKRGGDNQLSPDNSPTESDTSQKNPENEPAEKTETELQLEALTAKWKRFVQKTWDGSDIPAQNQFAEWVRTQVRAPGKKK